MRAPHVEHARGGTQNIVHPRVVRVDRTGSCPYVPRNRRVVDANTLMRSVTAQSFTEPFTTVPAKPPAVPVNRLALRMPCVELSCARTWKPSATPPTFAW